MMSDVLKSYIVTAGWGVLGALLLTLGVIISLFGLRWALPRLDLVAALREGNIAVAMVVAALLVSLGITLASVTAP